MLAACAIGSVAGRVALFLIASRVGHLLIARKCAHLYSSSRINFCIVLDSSPPPVCPTHTFVVQETSAAVKLQSTYRKHRTMCDLEDRGYSTAAMRNRARARAEGAQRSAAKPYLSDDAPSIMACCGVGLLFGEDAAGHTDQEALAEDRRKDFEQTKKLVKHLEERQGRSFK